MMKNSWTTQANNYVTTVGGSLLPNYTCIWGYKTRQRFCSNVRGVTE